jgi:phosphoglycolate phosphatase
MAFSARSDIRGVLFDKDGTLFGYDATWAAWCEQVLGELADGQTAVIQDIALASGYDMDSRTFRSGSLIVNGAADEVIALWNSKMPHHSPEHINRVSLRHLESLPNVPVCDFAIVLGQLRASGRGLGIATNDYEASARSQLKQAGAEGYFTFVAGFDSGHGAKPGPGMIEAFCRYLNLPASAVAMVGDSTHDLDAGRAAGVGMNVAVLTGPADREDLAPYADIVLADISELPAILGS